MRQDVKPTRAELRTVKRRLAMVRRGHKLLERKRESLMVELFKAIDAYRLAQAAAAEARRAAEKAIALAEMVAGRYGTWSYAFTRAGRLNVEPVIRSYMGVKLPEFTLSAAGGEQFAPGEIPQNRLASRAADELTGKLIGYAAAEAKVSALLDEVERTKRRVNALEIKVIPQLEEERNFIQSRLEEMERESLFSLKRIRAKLAAR